MASSVDRKQAEPLTVEEKNSLWAQGLLGDSSPQTLINTLRFSCGMHFTLESGQEHQSLQVTHIELVEPSDVSPYLIYVHREFSKHNAGGISHRKVQLKQAVHHANIKNLQWYLVHLYTKCLEHWPKVEEPTLYLKKHKECCVVHKNTGHNTLAKKCKVTQQSEQETATTNSLIPQVSTTAHAGTCAVHSDQETVTNTLIPSAFISLVAFNTTNTKNVNLLLHKLLTKSLYL